MDGQFSMIKLFVIFVILISVDSFGIINQNKGRGKLALHPPNYLNECNIGVNIMWLSIPNYPNYQFNPETLEVKSLERDTKSGAGNYAKQERILKPSRNRQGYLQFGLCNGSGAKTLKRSQISWLVKHGELPPRPLQIDHINADKNCDYIWNLQVLTNRQNISKGWQQNGTKYPTGISWDRERKKFFVCIGMGGKTKFLGRFVCAKEASEAYKNEIVIREL